MKTKETHDGEIKTYKDLRHVAVLPPELIQRKLGRDEGVRARDARIAPEKMGILQDILGREVGGIIKIPTLDDCLVTIDLDNDRQLLKTARYNWRTKYHGCYDEGAVFTATDEEFDQLKENRKAEGKVSVAGNLINKARLKYLQDAVETALDGIVKDNDKTVFEDVKGRLGEGLDPSLMAGIEKLCQRVKKRGPIKVQKVEIVRGGGLKENKNSGRGTCEWFAGYNPTYTRPGIAYEVTVALPDDIPVHPNRYFDRIILDAFDVKTLKILRRGFGGGLHRRPEKWDVASLKEEGNKIVMEWVFER